MQEIVFCVKFCICVYYVKFFKIFNEEFYRGQFMFVFINFYEEKKSIIESFIESCFDFNVVDDVFDVLVIVEQFLDMFLWREGIMFFKIYDLVLEEFYKQGENIFYRKLFVFKVFGQIKWIKFGIMLFFFNEVKEC